MMLFQNNRMLLAIPDVPPHLHVGFALIRRSANMALLAACLTSAAIHEQLCCACLDPHVIWYVFLDHFGQSGCREAACKVPGEGRTKAPLLL